MKNSYIPRSLEPVLKKAALEFPALVLTGPRQSGKTTLLKRCFAKTHRYVSLELPDVREAAMHDPRGFFETYPPPIILDEIQHLPELLPYVKERVDEERNAKGQFLLTGSQNLMMLQRVTESLAGRVAILRLLPLTRREGEGSPAQPLAWETKKIQTEKKIRHADFWKSLIRGSYPEIAAYPSRDARLWHASYIQTYLERDVRSLRQVGDLTSFQSFLRLLAARSGQLLNITDLARDLGIAVNTAKSWIAILEATYQIIVLRPYFGNVGKRLVKTPKVYFMDTGTLCHLAGVRDDEHAASGPLGGALFETAVVGEVYKTLSHRGLEPQLYFWRTSAGTEVDLVVDTGRNLVPLEVKLSATPRPAMAGSTEIFLRDFKSRSAQGYVVHPGSTILPLARRVTALPFSLL